MHYQAAPHAEVKLVRCTRGADLRRDLDLRPDSPTYRQWSAVELTADNRRCSTSPPGAPTASRRWPTTPRSSTRCPRSITPSRARGVRWDDPAFGIEWPPCGRRSSSRATAPTRTSRDDARCWSPAPAASSAGIACGCSLTGRGSRSTRTPPVRWGSRCRTDARLARADLLD